MKKYAESTTVPAGRSLEEIERTIQSYGGSNIKIGKDEGRVIVAFVLQNLPIIIEQRFPSSTDTQFKYTNRRQIRTDAVRKAAYDAEIRRLYRVLLLRLKSRFESIEAGETVGQAFLPYILGANGQTVEAAFSNGAIQSFIGSGKLPPLLPAPEGL